MSEKPLYELDERTSLDWSIKQPHDPYTPALCHIAIVSIEVLGNSYEHSDLLR